MESEAEEWKESWRKEYLASICAFANKNGGTMIIGKTDKGEVIGVSNPHKMLEEIPNTVRNALRFSPEVNAVAEKGKTIIVVKVEPQRRAVDYEGIYYTKSGSTRVALTGNQLMQFLLKKEGMSWVDLPEERIKLNELSQEAIDFFIKKGTGSGRMSSEAANGGNELLLKNYELMNENGLKRSGAILFSENPLRTSYATPVKIGAFSENGTILRDDIIQGPVIMQPDRVMDLLLNKYVLGTNALEGLMMVTKYPYPVRALREAVLNAVVHRDYSRAVDTDILVYQDRIEIRNPGRLPDGWTAEKLLEAHSSEPANPSVAKAFYDMRYIERYGSGIKMIREECAAMGLPEPEYEVAFGIFEVTFRLPEKNDRNVSGKAAVDLSDLTDTEAKIYALICEGKVTTALDMACLLDMSEKTVRRSVAVLVERELVKRIGSRSAGRWVPMTK